MPKRIIGEVGYCGAYFMSNSIGKKTLSTGDPKISKGNLFSNNLISSLLSCGIEFTEPPQSVHIVVFSYSMPHMLQDCMIRGRGMICFTITQIFLIFNDYIITLIRQRYPQIKEPYLEEMMGLCIPLEKEIN